MAPHGDAVEDQIRRAIEQGEFDNLPGAGKRLDLGEDDEAWWIKRRIAEMSRLDQLAERARAVAELEEALWHLPDPAAVRARVADINAVVADLNAHLPAVDHLSVLEPKQAVATWRRMFRLRG